MSEEVVKEEKQEFNFDDLAAKIEQSVTDKLDRSLSSLEVSLEEKLKPKEKEEDDFDYEETPLTKKDIEKLVKAQAQELEKKTNETMEQKSKKQQRDSQAIADFPGLNQQDKETFNQKFYNEVGREIQARVKNGRNPEDIDLVYDAAAAVAMRGTREGWYVTKSQAKQTNTKRNASEDNFDVGPSRSKGSTTEDQLKFAKKMGLSPERYKQVVDKYMKK